MPMKCQWTWWSPDEKLPNEGDTGLLVLDYHGDLCVVDWCIQKGFHIWTEHGRLISYRSDTIKYWSRPVLPAIERGAP